MANQCAICGADINLIQTQKLSDGNCICRKNCRKKGFKVYDYVHSNLSGVKAHLAQVERGTKLWEHYFIPRKKTKDKSKKLKRFGTYLYVAEDIGLMAYIQNGYKYEEQLVKNGDKTEKKSAARLSFTNTQGLYECVLPMNNFKDFKKLKKYFDTLFGIQNTLGNASNVWKQQMTAVKDIASGVSAAVKGEVDAGDKAAQAINSLDAAIYGDRTEWIQKADAALAAFNG